MSESPTSPDGPSGANGGSAPSAEAQKLAPVLESVLFASPEPLALAALRKILGEETPVQTILEALDLLTRRTASEERGVVLAQVAGGWQFLTREANWAYVARTGKTRAEERLTPAAIETLAIVAYKQPVTRAEVDAVRGSISAPHLRTLVERGLIKTVGRAEAPGQPFQYGTTKNFLRRFGLRSPAELPGLDELKRLAQEMPA
jgi:segregation and condensation protein B